MMPRLFRTAGFRLTALAAAIFVLCMLAVSLLIYVSVREDMEDQLRAQISAETRQLLGDYGDDGLAELRHDISERLERNPGTRLQYTLQNPDGIALFDRLPLPGTPGWSRIERDGDPQLILLTSALDDGYWLGVAADTESIADTAEALRHTLFLIMAPIIILGILAGAIVSQRFLSRVEKLKQTADRVGQGSLAARMETSGSGDDFDGLVQTINRMLDRIEGLVHDVRHVSTNIAHDLRTPLGRLRQRLEHLSSRQTDGTMRAETEDAIALLDETLATFSALLRIAELDTGAAPIRTDPVDLAPLLEGLAEIYQPIAAEAGKTLTVSAADKTSIEGDKGLLTQLVTNLIENAIRHTPEGTQIHLACGTDQGAPWLAISDTGPGIPEHERENVLKPFRRLDTSRSAPGSGLGLSLAASIAARHGGKLDMADARPGLAVTVRFTPTA